MCTLVKPFEVASHNGIITVKSLATGDHRTVRVRTQPKDSKFAPGERVAQLLVGSDNTSSYKAFAFIGEDGTVRLFSKNRDSKVFQWLKRFLETPEAFDDKVVINFEGHCRKCNRLLTTPESVASGIGPTCAQSGF